MDDGSGDAATSESDAESGRPAASYRDPAELGVRLAGWLAGRLPPGAAPSVTDAELPSGSGMSSDTVLFTATWTEDGPSVRHEMVARIAPDPTAVPVFPTYDLAGQFRTMELVATHSAVPVPRVRWMEPDPSVLGAPFFVMDRVHGRVPPDVLPYNFGSWVTELDAHDRRSLQDATVEVLALLHGIDEPVERFAHLDRREAPDGSALRKHVDGQREFYEWVVAGTRRSPLIEAAFDWLDERWPDDEGPTVLSWGDSRIGNMLFDGVRPVAVLDWEMAGLAPAEVDVAWCIFLHRFFEDIATQMELPGLPDFMRRDDVAATYRDVRGRELSNLDWFCTYAALRHAIVMSRVQRRTIHFGQAEEPDDVDDLIMHRSTLEAMLEDRYWSSLS